MGTTNDIASGLEARLTTIVRGSSPVEVDSIGVAPFAMVGDHSGTIEPGNWERINYTFPVNIYVERTADAARTAIAVNDILDLLIAASRVTIKLGINVSEALLKSWNTDAYAEITDARYKVIECVYEVTVAQGRTYTA